MTNQVNSTVLPTNHPNKKGILGKDFIILVLGQIISLFGNSILRFALPLYILEQSNSAALFGMVSALAFLPMIIMSPVAGIISDRANKQRMMVVLDFLTAGMLLSFIIVNEQIAMLPLVVVILMLLFGIQGAYGTAVRASLPLMVQGEQLVQANAIINFVQSFSGLLGPVLGGVLYGLYGLTPILIVSCVCFTFAALMELFMRIPFKPIESSDTICKMVGSDITDSLNFIFKEKSVMAHAMVSIFSFNLVLIALIVIGLPIIITQTLDMSNQLYGFAQGTMAVGGLVGGIVAGIFGKKLTIQRAYLLLLFCGIGLIPMGITLLLGATTFISYLVIVIMSFFLMIADTLFTVQILAFVQEETPIKIIGKVMSFLAAISVCAQPIGQLLYGFLFEHFQTMPWVILLSAALASCLISIHSKRIFVHYKNNYKFI